MRSVATSEKANSARWLDCLGSKDAIGFFIKELYRRLIVQLLSRQSVDGVGEDHYLIGRIVVFGFPFRDKTSKHSVWHSTVPFSHDVYEWVNYTPIPIFFNSDRPANSKPLSAVIVLNTSRYLSPNSVSSDFMEMSTTFAEWSGTFSHMLARSILSVRTNTEGSLSPFVNNGLKATLARSNRRASTEF